MSSAIESYEAELRGADADPALLKMCAQGAIAHAKMVEAELEEVRGLGAIAMQRWREAETARDAALENARFHKNDRDRVVEQRGPTLRRIEQLVEALTMADRVVNPVTHQNTSDAIRAALKYV